MTESSNGAVRAGLEEELWRLMNGYLTTQLLYVVAKLGVADVLAEGPQTSQAVAERVEPIRRL